MSKTNTRREQSTCHLFSDIEGEFCQAMQAAGIHNSDLIIADGRLHRFHIDGHKRSTKNGAYVLHLDGCPAGWFMDYTTGLSQTWKKQSSSRISYALTKQIQEAKRQREAETRQKHAKAANKANHIWNQSKPIIRSEDHQYLTTKQIQQYGTRLFRDLLAIPIYDQSDKLVNLQFISPEGQKRFLSGGRKRGCFNIIGSLTKRILICEGFATGASLFKDSEQRVIVAFDAGNLLPVAKNIKELAPDAEIIICGDNDISGIGQTKARQAALAIGGKVMLPQEAGMDWNDVISGGSRHAE